MRVLIDAYWWSDGPPSGRNVVRGIVGAWAATFPDDELHVLVARDAHFDGPPTARVHRTVLRPHGAATMLRLGLLARHVRADACISQNFGTLLGSPLVFVQDMIFVRHPEWFTTAERGYFEVMRQSMRTASTVLASSSAEAARIAQCLPRAVPVRVVGLAGAPGVIDADPIRPSGGFDDRFLLAVGRINVRKNIGRLLEAYGLLRERTGPAPDLVIVGSPDGAQESVPLRAATRDHVHFLATVTDRELSWLYRQCAGFVYPSLDEGYGLPPVEALALGARVAVSDIAVFHEILGAHARYFDPLDPSAIEKVLEQLTDPDDAPDAAVLPSWSDVVTAIRAACGDRKDAIG